MVITDGTYEKLIEDDVSAVISRLGKQKEADTEQLLRLLDALREKIT